jgi:hypothetical protein
LHRKKSLPITKRDELKTNDKKIYMHHAGYFCLLVHSNNSNNNSGNKKNGLECGINPNLELGLKGGEKYYINIRKRYINN